MKAQGPNATQIEYWNEQAGPAWVRGKSLIDAQIDPLGRAAVDAAQVRVGESVLDVGCGTGQTSLLLAECVGSDGRVLGVDISAPMLERARQDAAELPQLRFEAADAQTRDFKRDRFDLVFSRFGVMFFSDPVSGFANLRSALDASGRLAFVCWQELARNAWMRLPLQAMAPHLELPPPGDPEAPGPFAFADPERLQKILDRAGFRATQIEAREQSLRVGVGGGFDAAVDQALNFGPAGAAFRSAAPEQRAAAERAVREALTPHASPDGVRLASAAWIVTARP
ncbi:MAG: class I SAM-dependent methyltransferase [Myxococcales bacterium]|nr:class I SAM-dependent methyltransferase [Myxococcales bacterium]